MCPLVTDWISAISSAVSAFISILVLCVAWFQIKQVKVQLKSLAESQKNSTLMTVLELESEMNKRKENLDHYNFELRQYGIDVNSNNRELNNDSIDLFQDRIKVARENYLNSLDRLSYCIIHNYLSDRDWKTEYRDVLFDAVDNFSDCYGVSSRFWNTKKLYEKWKNE
ncbi:hypothetical protein FNO01nite_34540 [Flavobacterium noncentrifugens]|uniref:Uncharacterized protein n=1 Tax=Flavobacterium noncentrifugens TaxID=1128970 RepID=A0A1G9C2K8_9FLAO|nr:hypothetical protein [Flavobacterium noncentrifugens]GEP52782.1 hypothetical protein FNO01nite_34540 [Flavobacterium noncentrifugens]SDK45919.1 hypothetical protein SAMN04487935_3453 [Flavobacterium noncentrifugens]